jgi:hypothetical protein
LNRKPSKNELSLIKILWQKAGNPNKVIWSKIMVKPLNDGGMGSLRIVLNCQSENDLIKFGKEVSNIEFNDIDGIKVLASLNVDENGNLFELDLWKVDFSPLILIPELS